MITDKARVTTIITAFEAQDAVLAGLAELGVVSFSSSHVEGVGAHGQKRTGLTEAKNLEYVIVTSEPLAARVLAWVDAELLPRYPSIAYSTAADVAVARPLP